MPETTPLIKAALNLRGGAGFDVYMNLCIFTVFSLLLVYGIKPILSSHRQSFLRFLKNKNFDLQLFFFRVNITHHEGDFFCFVSCVLQDVSISMKVSGVPLRNILCLTRSG